MPLAPSTKLGPYEIVAPLGAGGMGEVYKARDTRLDRTVAIKILPDRLSQNPAFKERFEREARAVSSLTHPHICVLYDIGSQDGIDFLVMEYLDGETLAERLQKGPLPVEETLRCAIEIAGALDEAHRHGIVHRDLKPGNIMLTKSGAKLMDFGLARVTAPSSQPDVTLAATLTQEGTLLGTPQYMAPEQLQGHDADSRTDIFAFGAVLYEMTTGRKAFAGNSSISVAAAILEKEPEPIRALRPVTPAALERLVRSCLAKDPDKRWQNARDLQLELEWIRESAGQEAVPVRKRRREAAAWALALVLLLAAIGLAVFRSERATRAAQTYRASVLPPPGVSFAPYHFAVSPDGTRLAFAGIAADGRISLWVRSLEGRAAQQIGNTENAAYPFWAPDSRRIGFFADGKLKIADTASGSVQSLCDAPFGRGGAWNALGTIVFGPEIAGPLFAVSEKGGRPKPVTQIDPKSGQAHRWPWFLPDDRRFLYLLDWSTGADPHANGAYLGSLDGGEPKLVSQEPVSSVAFASGHLLYLQERSLLAQRMDLDRIELTGSAVTVLDQEIGYDDSFVRSNFSVSQNGVIVFQSTSDAASELIWFARDGRELGRIQDPGLKDPALSPDGRFLAVSADEGLNGKRFIRVYDLSRGVATRLTDGGREEYPIWSRDGTRIAYASRGTGHIYEVAADGSGKPTVLLEGARMLPNDYSPDGRYLAYMTFEKGPPQLAVYDIAARKTSVNLGRGGEGQLSPDGKWLARTAFPQVIVHPFSGPGARIQVTSAGGAQPRWSRDGKRLFFTAPDRKLMEVSIDVRDGKLQPGAPRALFQTHITAPRFAVFQYDVTPDGSRFLVNSLKPNAPLTLVSNWPAALDK